MENYKVTVEDGITNWYNSNDQLHRIDGPAIEDIDGYEAWLRNGKFHRIDGPAVITSGGSIYWYKNDELHRTDGPAVERSDGYIAYHQNGVYHRQDGPAVEEPNGTLHWFLNGTKLSEEEFIAASKPAVEYSVQQLEELLHTRIKIVKG